MSDSNVERDMTRASKIDTKIESLLSGAADLSDPLVSELAVLRQGLAEAFPLPVIPEHIEDSHLARMMAAVVPAASLATSEIAADRTGPLTVLKASFARRVAAVTLALSTAFGGAAYAGVLPDPVQRAVAEAASVVGLDLPGDEADTLAENESGEDRRDAETGNSGDELGPVGSQDDEAGDLSGATDEDGDDERRDAREDAEDEAEDRRDDEQDDAEDGRDDARDAEDDAADDNEDEADDRRDEAEDRDDDETDEREDEEDDAHDALDEAEDDADDSREELEDLEEENRSDVEDLDDDDDDDDSERSDDEESED